MSYLTLREAAAYINHRSVHEIEPAALLRAGVHGALLIAAPFSGLMRNMTYSRDEDVLGLLIIPPRHLLEIELEGGTRILGAISLDGGTMYSPQVKRTLQQLVILVSELDRFIPMLVSPLSEDVAQPSATSSVALASAVMLWTEHAQAAAARYIARHKAQNLYPSQTDVANAVEVELRTDGVMGDNGRPVSAAYIARNALRGKWWAQNKPKP
jgi:hypothetical protein